MDGFNRKGRRSVDCARLKTLTILANEIPSKALNYGVNCHQIKVRWNWAFIFTFTAMSEGLFAWLEGYLCHLGGNIIVLQSFRPQLFKSLIVHSFSCPVETTLWQSEKHHKPNNDVFCIEWHQLCLLFPLLGVGSHVGGLYSWDNLRTTQFAQSCTRSEQSLWYVRLKQHSVSQTVLAACTISRLEAPHSWSARGLCMTKAGPFCDG